MYIELLPQIINSVCDGNVSDAQKGYADINIPACQGFIRANC
jgi:hypothetical protein